MSATNNQNQPGLVASHAQYVKGAAVEQIGNVSGSEEWKRSGAEEKDHAVSAMKEAGEKRDHQAQGFGKAEEMAGKAVGCEGMRREGEESVQKQ
ncbi:hypothetical protein GQ43DRAFT_368022 [Delitschia confertaspora ATCC 74209]|uniref:CsbD-like protein n=1 Tax=Delitschia confertaspora ATCC 74209 TaxID=1513339 RepID=A0A9P4JTG8_9PLEO|nr:hypothetical protein GQ43DRAFT_368022 [Delitschia confertaspora ATCC 74209]